MGKLSTQPKQKCKTLTRQYNNVSRTINNKLQTWSPEVSQGGYTRLIRSGTLQRLSIWDLVQDELTIARCAHDPTIPYNQLKNV